MGACGYVPQVRIERTSPPSHSGVLPFITTEDNPRSADPQLKANSKEASKETGESDSYVDHTDEASNLRLRA